MNAFAASAWGDGALLVLGNMGFPFCKGLVDAVDWRQAGVDLLGRRRGAASDLSQVIAAVKNPIEAGRNLIEAGKNLIEAGKNLIEPAGNLIEPEKNLIEAGKNLIEAGKNLIEAKKNLIEPAKNLIEPGKNLIEAKKNLIKAGANLIEAKRRAAAPQMTLPLRQIFAHPGPTTLFRAFFRSSSASQKVHAAQSSPNCRPCRPEVRQKTLFSVLR
jgi:hypothetical protein